jgi:hypothetical protein
VARQVKQLGIGALGKVRSRRLGGGNIHDYPLNHAGGRLGFGAASRVAYGVGKTTA